MSSTGSERAVPPKRGLASWHVLGLAVLAQAGFSVLEQGIPMLSGFIKADLDLSAAGLGLAVSAFFGGKIVGSYWAGVAADLVGERHVLVAGGIATGLTAMLAVLMPVPIVFVLLAFAGAASATSTPAGGRLVLVAFPPGRRGLALGIRQTAVPAGGFVASFLLPGVASAHGWRVAVGLGGLITVAAVLPLLLAPAGGSPRDRRRSRLSVRDREIVLLTIWSSLLVTGQFAILTFLPLELHESGGWSLTAAALVVGVAQLAGIVGRIAWGAVSDRLVERGRHSVLVTLTAGSLGATIVLLLLPPRAPVAAVLGVAALTGVTLIGYQGVWMAMLAESAGPARVGAATGFALTFTVTAITISPPLYGLAADLAGTYSAVWIALALVLCVAFVPVAMLRERRQPDLQS